MRESAVHGDGAAVRHRAARRRAEEDLRHGKASLAEERVEVQVLVKGAKLLKNRRHLVDRVVAPFRSGPVAGEPPRAHLDLHTAAVAAVDVARRGLGKHHKFRRVLVLVDDVLPAEAVAILLLDGAHHHQREVARKPQILDDLPRVDHGGHAALLVAGASADDDLVVLVPLVGVVGPKGAVADSDGIDVRVEGDQVFAVPDEAEHVPHGVDLDSVVPAGLHLGLDAMDHFLLPAALAGKSDHVPKEAGHLRLVLFRLAQNLLEGNHGIPSFMRYS